MSKVQVYKEFIDMFQEMLDTAVQYEEYEQAAELRDVVNELKHDKTLIELGLEPASEIRILPENDIAKEEFK